MTKTVWKFALAATLTAAVIVACSDGGRIAGPSATRAFPGAKLNVMGACTTIDALKALAVPLFGAGTPNVNSVLGKLDNLAKKVAAGNVAEAQDQANNIVRFVRDKAAQGQLLGTQAQITEFISGTLCYAGLSPDTFLILPSDDPQIRISNEGTSGISLEGNTVTEPTLLTLTSLDPAGPSPLVTKLDQYPSYVAITATSQLIRAAVVAVCPLGEIPQEVRDRLRLGHQATTGFEITPPESGAFLPCAAGGAGGTASFLRRVANLFVPKPLYAAMESGGVGGSVTEFSPFGAVDPELGFSGGGVGGSATEFLRAQPNSLQSGQISVVPNATANSMGPSAPTGVTAVRTPTSAVEAVDCSSATVGTELPAACRPNILIATHNGTIFEGVPVAWAVTEGGGTIAASAVATETCGSFDQTAATTTDASGRVSICWILGPNGGANSATATPGIGGDAPAGVTFVPARLRFTATGLKITPTASATGGNFVFDNTAHAGSGTCSNDLTPALTYSGDAAPSDVGSYTLTVTCGAGSTVYNTVTATANISITPAVPSVNVSCPASVVYDGSAQSPCSASVAAPGLSAVATPVYVDNVNVGTATAIVSLAAYGNYAAAMGTATFAITPAVTTTVVSCSPTSLAFTGSPLTPCSATTTGAGGLSVQPTVSYSGNVDAGTATASASFAATLNHQASSGSTTFTIEPAATTTTVSCPASAAFTNAAIEPCTASVAGPGGLDGSVTPTYSANTHVGTAEVSATFAGGGNYLASTGTATFLITPAATAVTLTCAASSTYNGAVQNPCSASVAGPGLSEPVSVDYSPAAPVAAGTYTATSSYAGGGDYAASSQTAAFAIDKRAATATAGSGTINFGSAVPTLPCSVSGLLSGDAGSVTCTTSVPVITIAGPYATTPVVSPATPANYVVSGVNGTLTVLGYTQVNCFSSPIYSVMPPSKSAQRKGSNLPVKCGLTTPQGAPVTTAKGNLVVVDYGTSGAAPGATVFAGTNVFKYSTGGNYAYGLDTSPAGFVAGHYYYVTATWNDGSTSTGWFLLK